ncbi:MAG: glutamate ligase domain-containing protein [Gaiella sp.]
MPAAESGKHVQASLVGRRFYFVGIGGSGLSAYANIARSLGAEVAGWDLRDTVFMRALEGVAIDLGNEPTPPPGWEVVLSTAHLDRADGMPRALFLAELVRATPSIVVGGAHGKTTTAAMIAFVLQETGRDPSFAIGGIVPQLGGNGRAGSGYLVVEGDESDRSIGELRPEIAVVTNIELDHFGCYASEAELRTFFERWLAGVPHVVRSWELEPAELELTLPGAHNRQNAAAALAALELAGVARAEAEPVLQRFTGADRRFQLVGAVDGITVIDDYGHNPTELRVTLETARERTSGRLVAVYQPHVNERTRHLAAELAEALGAADIAVVTEVTGARDTPRDGVSGKWVLDRLPGHVRGVWAPTLDAATPLTLSLVRPGDVVVTLGVGEPWRVARAIVDGLSTSVCGSRG